MTLGALQHESESASEPAVGRSSGAFGPWLWSPGIDLAVFGGTTLVAFGLLLALREAGLAPGALPAWGWLIFVLGIDVAHVWSTLFRTYLDREELGRHRLRYIAAPAVAYAAGVALYSAGPLWFWRVLAYVAVFHFIRQQVGWVALYRARALADQRLALARETVTSGNPERGGLASDAPLTSVPRHHGRSDKLIDECAVYAATLYPVLHWHAHLDTTEFSWFVKDDFVDVSGYALAVLPFAKWLWIACLTVFFLRQAWLYKQESTLQLGKLVVVVTTSLIWYVGIVLTNSDAEFTLTNVIAHGVPYMVLLYFYGRERRRVAPEQPGSQILSGGLLAFIGSLLLLAFFEELLWDRFVWREHAWLFGASDSALGATALCFLVPLLALPQFTHYLLDGVLWRRQDSRENVAQRAAIGMR